MFQRREQVRTQTSFLFAHSIQIPTLQKQRKKALGEIFRLFWFNVLSSHETINRSPVCAAKLFQCRVCLRRFALRCQHHAPVRGGKCNGTGLSALTDRTPRRSVINGRHAAIQVKSRPKSKPAVVSKWTAAHACNAVATAGRQEVPPR